MKSLIDDFAAIGTAGINFTGGEPTLRPDCFELMSHAKKAGMAVNISTNAFNLVRPELVDKLLDSGVDSINISVDGACAVTHDRLRGRKGAFERVARATELLVERRRNKRPSITYLFVVGPDNHSEIPDFLSLARARGVDSVGFMPLAGTYRAYTPFTNSQIEAMAGSMLRLREIRQRHPDFIDNSDGYLSLFESAWRGDLSPLKCYAAYNHLAVDCYGNIYPCGLWFTVGRASGNIRDIPVREYWGSERETRRLLTNCRECYWNCHSEMNLLYGKAGL